ncbi:hypothetical protein P171DRAFT_389315, partial [Karstenula rhodostoma CBS 690.94]
MKPTHFWAALALTHAPAVLSQGLRQATGGHAATPTPTSTTAAPASSCTASLLTTLCDYKDPGSQFAVASSGRSHCWEYCNAHQPCNFVVLVTGNPHTGTGTCWLYPGEDFDASAGTTGCDYLSVYEKPTYADDAATPTAGTCEATASPSAIAEVCGYPEPEDQCFYSCAASSGAVDCLSQCAEDSCAFAIFYTGEGGGSPYASGTCWKYPNGTYDAGKAGTCEGKPEQYVYENKCPKVAALSTSSLSLSSTTSSAQESGAAKPTETASGDDVAAEEAKQGKGGAGEGSGAAGVSFSSPLAAGMAAALW